MYVSVILIMENGMPLFEEKNSFMVLKLFQYIATI
uniref:Uncharacterized protein n=1 Tax=Arundo donax TaxID=35708 RepID=A0A0A9AMB9_ARUDO